MTAPLLALMRPVFAVSVALREEARSLKLHPPLVEVVGVR